MVVHLLVCSISRARNQSWMRFQESAKYVYAKGVIFWTENNNQYLNPPMSCTVGCPNLISPGNQFSGLILHRIKYCRTQSSCSQYGKHSISNTLCKFTQNSIAASKDVPVHGWLCGAVAVRRLPTSVPQLPSSL